LASGEATRILGADTGAIYSQRDGHILFVRQGTLLSQAFDPKRVTLTNEPVPVAEHVESGVVQGVTTFSVSETGILSYGIGSSAAARLQMSWVDRHGKLLQTIGPEESYQGVALSPDGTRIAAHRHENQGGDIWVTELTRGTTSRLTFDPSQDNASPVWSPDGSAIVFQSRRAGRFGLYRKAANNVGDEELLVGSESDVPRRATSWAPDGRSISFGVLDPKTGQDLWSLLLSGNRQVVPWQRTPFNENEGKISPDGKWLAYQSNETGRYEISVRPYPDGAGKWQISTEGGSFPAWRADGGELFYLGSNGTRLFAIDVNSGGPTFSAGMATNLFNERFGSNNAGGGHPYANYAVSADGQRFLVARPSARDLDSGPPSIAVVLNWQDGLKK
jgi:dipeptidyl aminopeptidase/acylaminoacyl peptidase